MQLSLICSSAQLKIEEISRMLRTGELGIPDNPDERYMNYFTLFLSLSMICNGVFKGMHLCS